MDEKVVGAVVLALIIGVFVWVLASTRRKDPPTVSIPEFRKARKKLPEAMRKDAAGWSTRHFEPRPFGTTEPSRTDDGFVTGMVLGEVTGDPIVSGLVSGNMGGALLGTALHDIVSPQLHHDNSPPSFPDNSSHGSSDSSSSSYDSGSSSFDSGSSGSDGGGGF